MQKVKLSIENYTEEQIDILKRALESHNEFELCLGEKHETKAANTLNSALVLSRASDIFLSVGIPPHIQGFKFLRTAIISIIERPSIINAITRELYPFVANKYDTTPSKVERAIRHAIEIGWSRGKIENINTLFGVKVYGHNDRPTNGEFMALIADKIMLENMK
ncbi:MAG: sporulation initiation factor Spo0A C-terminal domain-containing protein [Firmicutes bacterium]|nr:sporulation initiation factor Spo0A C-terminal domain-containing protein [Bacillota bacterium]